MLAGAIFATAPHELGSQPGFAGCSAAARGERDIVVQCRGFLEELNWRGNHLVVSEEMIAKLRQTYVDFCRQRRQ